LFSLGCNAKEVGNEGCLPWDVAYDHAVQLVPGTALSTSRAVETVIGDKNEQTLERNGMKITSSAFQHHQKIPRKYTCDGQNINPPLVFVDVPQAARSLVLIVDDPDAPRGTWVHWLVYNIPFAVREVQERSVPRDGIEGLTSSGKPGYAGPCPPSGTHRYCFKLYALDAILGFDRPQRVDTKRIEERMKDHILEQTELIGLYSRS
jgi:Raf kinase inhibitor-like YbhB/YbcL family protein